MSATAYSVIRMTCQVVAFLIGLALVLIQVRRAHPSSFWLAVGLALALGGTADLLIAWRALHLLLIVAASRDFAPRLWSA